MHQPTLVTFSVLLITLTSVYSGKILVYPMDGSHWVNMNIIIEELHSKGHSVTVLRPADNGYIKEKSPHYTSVNVPNCAGFDEDFFSLFVSWQLELRRMTFWPRLWSQMRMGEQMKGKFIEIHKDMGEMIVQIFEDENTMRSLRDAKFDVMLTDPGTGGGTMLARRLGLPLVFNVRWTIQGEGHFILAPSPLSYVPFVASELTDKMTFLQRLQNVLFYLADSYPSITGTVYKPLVSRYFGPDVDYSTFFLEADIWLMRNDFVFDFPRPTMPNIIYISGFQCKPSKPLPQDLEDFVQSSGEHGVIMMSLGTLIAQLPEDIPEEIAAAFAQLPQKVIWKHSGPRPVNLGNNTIMVDWLPQNDLLGHPKTRVFISHGGTNGLQEAIYHGVPLLGLPLVLDQPDNLSKMTARGAAKVVDIANVDRQIFLDALKAVLYEPSYRENMERLSRLHRDQPMKPLDRAVFWIEFVMRHRGAPHLRTESYKMSWIAYHSVDVMATLLAIVLLITLVCITAVRVLCRKMFCRRKAKNE